MTQQSDDRIVYTIKNKKEEVVFASLDQRARNTQLAQMQNTMDGNTYTKGKRIVDFAERHQKIVAATCPIDLLVLKRKISPRPNYRSA